MTLDLFWCILIGYAFGNILTAELIGKIYQKSLFEHGSGNPGMTNTIKVLGKKAGALVLLGDILKTCAAVGICVLLFPQWTKLIPLYTGIGVTLGHCFPIWHHFEGGKGVAVVASSFVLYWPAAGFCALAVGGLGILLKRGVKLSAVLIDVTFMIWLLFRFAWITFIPAGFMAVLMAYLNLRPNRLSEPTPEAIESAEKELERALLEDKAAADAQKNTNPLLASSRQSDALEADLINAQIPGE